MKTLTVAELVDELRKLPPKMPVLAWTPGSYWTVGVPFVNEGRVVLLEGNLTNKSEHGTR